MSCTWTCTKCDYSESVADSGGTWNCPRCAGTLPKPEPDPVNHPKHYTSHPSGIECIEITRHMGFNLGNAVKYLWRCDLKRDAIEDLKKAIWYINDEITMREKAKGP